MRRFLPSLEAKTIEEDATRRATTTGMTTPGFAYRSHWNVDRAIRDGYERVIWVFRAVDFIASNAARLPIEIRQDDEMGRPVGNTSPDPLLRLLNRRTNTWEQAAAFRYRLASQLLLSKRGVFIEVVRSRMGDPISLSLLPCGHTAPIPDPKTFVSGFEVTVAGVPEIVPAYEEDGVTPHVLWIRKPHPTDPYSGVTPMEAAGLSIDMDFYARLYNRCLRQTEWVRLADGTRRQARDLIGKNFKLLTMTKNGQTQVNAWATAQAVEPIYRVTTESGRTLEVNGRHPLWAGCKTARKVESLGWTGVAELAPDAYVAVPAVFEARPDPASTLTEDEAFVLGALVGDGSITTGQPVLSAATDGSFVKEFTRAVESIGDLVTRRKVKPGMCGAYGVRARVRRTGSWSLTRQLVERVGLMGCNAHTKFVPDEVFGASKAAQAAFLGGYFAADGCISGRLGRVQLASVNRRLLADVQELLLRFGVCSRIYEVAPHALGTSVARGDTTVRGAYSLAIDTAADVGRFAARIAVPGKQDALDAAYEVATERLGNGRGHKWRTRNIQKGLRWERVSSVEVVGEDLTVGISVPHHHTYLGTFYEHNTFLQNDGRPGGVLAVKGKTTDDTKSELRSRFLGGGSNAGRVTVINADAATWVDTAITPRDAQFAEIMRLTKTDILDAFGVYESLIGNASGRTFDNAGQEKRNFWQETMPPFLDLIAGGFDFLTQGGIEDDLYVVHDTEGVPILQADRQAREEHLKALFDVGLITQDEFREETGRDPFNAPGTDSLWIGGTKKPIGGTAPEPPTPPPPAPVVVHAPPADPGAAGDAAPTDGTTTASARLVERKSLANDGDSITRAVDRRATVVSLAMKRLFARQERVVLERLAGVKARRGTPIWDPPGTKAVDVGDLFDRERWDGEVRDEASPIVEDAYAEESSNAGVDLDRDAVDAAVAVRLANTARINDTTEAKLADAVQVGDGETAEDVRRRVQGVFEEARNTRAAAIGETEAAGMTNDARDLIASVTGAERKRWRNRGDSVVRQSHKDAGNLDWRDVGESFPVGGATLRYPGDPTAPIRETARCRCWTEYESPSMR